MPKPIALRGFEVDKSSDKTNISYSIDNDGLEIIHLNFKSEDGRSAIMICVDDGEIKQVYFNTPQLKKTISKEILDNFSENDTQNFEEAKKIYNWAKKYLDVETHLKNYVPRFSHESEITLFNILGIEDEKGLEYLLKKDK